MINPNSELTLDCNPPLGMLNILEYTREKLPRHEYFFKDFNLHKSNAGEQVRYLKEIKPDIIGIGAMTDNFPGACFTAKLVREHFPGCKIILGGHHVTSVPDGDYDLFDCTVVGEGEEAFLKIVNILESGEAELPRRIKVKENMKNIDIACAWDLVENLHEYHMAGHPFAYRPMVAISGSRGCPYVCTFCSSLMWRVGKVFYRFRTPSHVVDEIESVQKKYGVDNFFFTDDAMNGSIKFIRGLCREIIDRKLKIRWAGSFLGDRAHTPEDIFPLLKKSGCKIFGFGVESGSERTLKMIRKKINLEDVERTLLLAKKAKLSAHVLFMIGNAWFNEEKKPDGETFEDITATKNLIMSLADKGLIFSISLSIAKPYPGSELGDVVEKFNLLKDDAVDIHATNRRVSTFHHPRLTDQEIQDTFVEIWQHISLHPRVIWNHIAAIDSFEELFKMLRIVKEQVAKIILGFNLSKKLRRE